MPVQTPVVHDPDCVHHAHCMCGWTPPKAPAKPRIDTLVIGQVVTLNFADRYTQNLVFGGIKGDGDDRRAKFIGVYVEGNAYDFEAYRVNGRWCFGSSAERLYLDEVTDINVAV